MPLSRSEELRLNACAIRIAIWDLGIWIGLLFAVATLVGAEYRLVAVPVGVVMCILMARSKRHDWEKVVGMEEREFD